MTTSFHIQVLTGTKLASVHFERPSIRIGRSPDNDLVLPDASVNERHAHLIHEESDYEPFALRDFGTRQVTLFENGASVTMGRYGLTFVTGAPPSEREAEFLRHLEAHPADDQARLVYGDWLEENGKPAEAEFIRAQLRLLTLDPGSREFSVAKHVLHDGAARLAAHWRRVVARPEIENCGVRFELQCPKQWAALTPTSDPHQRFCGSCQRNVHYAPTVDAARRLALAGECVAIDVAQRRRPGDLEPEDYRYVTAGLIAP